MSTEVEQLTEDIRNLGIAVVSGPPVDLSGPLARHLIKAGYRKPRIITTAAERLLLPAGTVAMDEQGNAWKRGTGSWVGTGEGAPLWDDMDLTLAVLHMGGAV